MAVAIIQNGFPGDAGTQMYDGVSAELNIEGDPPQGLLFHWAGYVDGEWTITDVWESAADFERFFEGRLRPAIEKLGGPDAVKPENRPNQNVVELHNHVKP